MKTIQKIFSFLVKELGNSLTCGFVFLIIISSISVKGGITYTYDSLNRLTNVDYGNGSVISYTYDTAGNRLTYSGAVANDTIAPSITITSPTTGSSYTNTTATINLSGTASDNTGVTLVAWQNYSGGLGVASGTNSWSIAGIPLQTGENDIVVTAWDAAGNSSDADLVVTLAVSTGGATNTVFTDNFTGNAIDSTKWITSGNTVVQTNQTMEVLTTVTDGGGSLTSLPFAVNPTGKITITRQTFLHYANDYFIGGFLIQIGALPWFAVDYANMDYSDGVTYMPCHGFFLTRNNSRADFIQSQTNISAAMTPLWDTWFNEKVTYDPVTGTMEYFTNDVSAMTFDVGVLPATNAPTMTLSFNAWGWFTGHEQFFSNLVVTQTAPGVQTGSLRVTISPAAAITAGATWQVDGGTPQTSGATVSNLSLSNHAVSFNSISGWTTPASQSISVSANLTATSSGTYVVIPPQTGSVQVTISPAAAITAGATWQVDGGTPQSSGTTVSNLSVSNHIVSFNSISGWRTPASQTVSVSANSTATASGTYVVIPPQTGSLQVTISPASAITDGAKWQVDGGSFQNGGATVTNLSVANHTVSFSTIGGWTTPANQTVAVNANSTATSSGTYVISGPTGFLQITIGPASANAAGAQWQVDDGTFQKSSTTASNLSVGHHTVSFNAVSGWTTPANQTVSIKAKAVAKAKGNYTFSAQGIYNGLFSTTNGVSEETAGMLSGLDVTASGTYTGKLLIGGSTHAISGGFNVSGQASNFVQRTTKLGGPLVLEMTLNWDDSPPNLTGTVSGTNSGPWVANLTNELALKGSSSSEYTAWVVPDDTPPGYGYMLITNHPGAVTLSVTLADGTSFSQAVPLSGAGDLPVYGNLYSSKGLVLGWIGLESGSPFGNLTWIKPASRSTALYTNGFTNQVVVEGSPWTNRSPHTAAINLPLGKLDISGGNLSLPLSFDVALSNNNALVKLPGSPTNSLTGSINPKTGLLTVTFGDGIGKATVMGHGAAMQNSNAAAGFFLGKTNAGSIILAP
jgi:hypothetical protein